MVFNQLILLFVLAYVYIYIHLLMLENVFIVFYTYNAKLIHDKCFNLIRGKITIILVKFASRNFKLYLSLN
jgi:hypothetical protein